MCPSKVSTMCAAARRHSFTHNISEGLSLATHAAVMNAGKLLRLQARDALDTASYAEEYRELVGGAA